MDMKNKTKWAASSAASINLHSGIATNALATSMGALHLVPAIFERQSLMLKILKGNMGRFGGMRI